MSAGRVVVGVGKASVVLDDGAARMVQRVLRQAAPEVLAVLEREADEITEEARGPWPRKSGRSARELTWQLRIRAEDIVETVVFDPVPYVFYIKGKKQGGKSTWMELVVKPGRKRINAIAEEIGSKLKRVALGGV